MSSPNANASLLWKRTMASPNVSRYNLTPFAITLNELTPGLKVYNDVLYHYLICIPVLIYASLMVFYSLFWSRVFDHGLKENLPPTDSRLRPDQRHLENGEYDKANFEKQRLEKRQRMVCLKQSFFLFILEKQKLNFWISLFFFIFLCPQRSKQGKWVLFSRSFPFILNESISFQLDFASLLFLNWFVSELTLFSESKPYFMP